MKNILYAGLAATILVAALTSPAISRTASAAFHEDDGMDDNGTGDMPMDYTGIAADNATERVSVGGGNLTVAINQFIPSSVQIEAGQSVTFYAPSGSAELHNVIFDLSNGSVISALELPFILPQGVDAEQLELVQPYNLGGPIIQEQEDGSQAIVALNKLAYYPGVSDQDGEVTYLLDEQDLQRQIEEAMEQGLFLPMNLTANYTMDGSEQIVSSGIVMDISSFGPPPEEELPTEASQANITTVADDTQASMTEEMAEQNATVAAEDEFPPIPYPFLNSFTVTFEEPGAYPFFCAFHPAMSGMVVVTEQTNSTQTSPVQ